MSHRLIMAEGSELRSNHPDGSSVLFPPKQTSPQSRKSLMEQGWGRMCVGKPAQNRETAQGGVTDEAENTQKISTCPKTRVMLQTSDITWKILRKQKIIQCFPSIKHGRPWVCDVKSKLTFLQKSCCVCRKSSSSNAGEPWNCCRAMVFRKHQEAFQRLMLTDKLHIWGKLIGRIIMADRKKGFRRL